MMSKIQILPDHLVNLIAAGEVIEGPASVVKELVENSLDAGASRISIETLNGGRDLVQVNDDGSGIAAADLATAVKRHATSKLHSSEQLWAINTLGFRGEALASICEVAKVELASKTAEAATGFALKVQGGVQVSLEPLGMPVGTTVMVEELFYNTPARAKYLKKQTGENRKIIKIVQELALANPAVMFTLTVEGQVRLNTPGDGAYLSTASAIYGTRYISGLTEIKTAHVEGWIGKVGHYASNRNDQVFAVNGRVFRNQPFTFCVENAYKGSLPVRRFPTFLLNILVEPGTVDVNVHPAKQEVKFQYEEQIRGLLYRTVKEALAEPEPVPVTIQQPVQHHQVACEPNLGLSWSADFVQRSNLSPPQPQQQQPTRAFRYLGQFANTYLIWEYDGALVLMDQHAAHERILFEEIMAMLRKQGKLAQQELLMPAVLQLTPTEWAELWNAREVLARFGFILEEFGVNTLAVRGVPVALRREEAMLADKDTLLELAASLEKAGDSVDEYYWSAAQLAACKAAIKAGDMLSDTQAVGLIEEWLKLSVSTCPHGRPIIKRFDQTELAKFFLRS